MVFDFGSGNDVSRAVRHAEMHSYDRTQWEQLDKLHEHAAGGHVSRDSAARPIEVAGHGHGEYLIKAGIDAVIARTWDGRGGHSYSVAM